MEFTIRDVATRMWRERVIVALVTGILLFIVIIASFTITPKYSATMVVGPVETTLDPSRTSSSPLSGVSSLLSTMQRVTPFQIYLKMYKSPELAAALIHDHDILKVIFSDRWDAAGGKWRARTLPGRLMSFFTGAPVSPTVNDLSDNLNSIIALNPGDGEEMQTVTVLYKNKEIARQLLQWVHEEAEALSKRRVQQRAQSNIVYLNQKLAITTQTEQRSALISLLLSQENTLMGVQNWNAYSGDVISGPWVSDRPVVPNPPLLAFLAILGGLVIGCGISFVRMLMGLPLYKLRPNGTENRKDARDAFASR